jgi:hypothetical protein
MITQLAAQVADNSTMNGLVCPTCNGGTNNDRSLCITKEGGQIKWICFRAKCGYRGVVGDNPNNVSSLVAPAKPVTQFMGESYALSMSGQAVLQELYGLTVQEMGDIRWCNMGYLFHIRDYYHRITGECTKRGAGTNGRKSMVYGERGQMHYENPHDGDTVVIVEDMLSAKRVGRHAPCVALLGTNMSHQQAIELAGNYKRAVFMLDEDAWSKSVNMATKYNSFFLGGTGFMMWESGLDPKDMSDAALVEVLLDNEVI